MPAYYRIRASESTAQDAARRSPRARHPAAGPLPSPAPERWRPGLPGDMAVRCRRPGPIRAARHGGPSVGQRLSGPGGNSRAVCRRSASMPTTARARSATITRTWPRLLIPGMKASQSRNSTATAA
jgi:hypothetical protein